MLQTSNINFTAKFDTKELKNEETKTRLNQIGIKFKDITKKNYPNEIIRFRSYKDGFVVSSFNTNNVFEATFTKSDIDSLMKQEDKKIIQTFINILNLAKYKKEITKYSETETNRIMNSFNKHIKYTSEKPKIDFSKSIHKEVIARQKQDKILKNLNIIF